MMVYGFKMLALPHWPWRCNYKVFLPSQTPASNRQLFRFRNGTRLIVDTGIIGAGGS